MYLYTAEWVEIAFSLEEDLMLAKHKEIPQSRAEPRRASTKATNDNSFFLIAASIISIYTSTRLLTRRRQMKLFSTRH